MHIAVCHMLAYGILIKRECTSQIKRHVQLLRITLLVNNNQHYVIVRLFVFIVIFRDGNVKMLIDS